MGSHYDCVIIGGGPIGCLAALTAARRGQHVLVLESRPRPEVSPPDYRAIAMTRSSETFLQTLGVWDDLRPYAHPVTSIIAQHTTSMVCFDPSLMAGESLAHMVNAAALKNILHTHATRHPHITWRYATTVTHFDTATNPATLTLCDSSGPVTTSLIVACDGSSSATRRMARLPAHEWSYHQTAIVTGYTFTEGPLSTAFEIVQPKGSILAILPLPNHQFSSVWMVPDPEAQRLSQLTDAAFDAELAPWFKEFHQPVRFTPRTSTSLTALWVPHIVRPRLMLVGDASHRIHPLAGLGLNLGIQDIHHFDQHLEESLSLGLDIGSLTQLKKYQQKRRIPHAGFLAATDSLNRLLTSSHPLPQWLRDQSFAWARHSPPLKKLLLEYV